MRYNILLTCDITISISYFFQAYSDNKSKERAEQELEKLRKTIADKERELDKIKPAYEDMKKKEDSCTR